MYMMLHGNNMQSKKIVEKFCFVSETAYFA